LVSALYVGRTKYLDEKNYNAEDNVAQFINDFFPDHSKRIPRVLWDGVRNGVDHLFIPKTMQCAQNKILFNFRRGEQDSDVYRTQGIICISINVIAFHRTLRQAIEDYKNKLQNDEQLQSKFINAWSLSIFFQRIDQKLLDDHLQPRSVKLFMISSNTDLTNRIY